MNGCAKAIAERSFFVSTIVLALSACHSSSRPVVAPTAIAHESAVPALQHDVDAILAAPALGHGYWGILVRSLKSNDTLYEVNAGRLMMPASNLKIVTLAAAAERLGWDYTYETRLLAAGAIEAGVLDGDLVVVGSGDPSLTEKNSGPVFETWAERLKAAGVRTIRGRIVGDDRAFDDDRLGMGWSWDDLAAGWAAGVSALQYNENSARVTITPGTAVDSPAAVALSPTTSGLSVRNLVRTSAAGQAADVAVIRLPGSRELELKGSVPVGASPLFDSVSVDNPALFYVEALRIALLARGISVEGPAVDVRTLNSAPSYENATVVVAHRSPPLSELAVTLMKQSQNLYGETLLKTLGAAAGTPTIEAGRKTVTAMMQRWGIRDGSLIERDGSGLSRYNYITAEALVGILTHVDRDDRLREPFEAALPIAGRDGTMSNRMKATAAEGNARAKTGSMSNVRGWSGYVTSADGEPLVFSILANNFEVPADAINSAAEAIVVRLAAFRR
jgi:D-alanyl-D-alanine carboxypeptidase/D-alanyl-D-alanine-endopeptidase (penicillin-binding protein 4)